MRRIKKALLSVACGVFGICFGMGFASCDIQGMFDKLYGYSAWDTFGFYMSTTGDDETEPLVVEGIREMDESGDVVIPEKCDYAPNQMGLTVVGINDWAFHSDLGAKMKSITLPSTITFIGNGAFEDCINLEKVYFNGTATQWSQIEFENAYANPLYYAKEFYINNQLVNDITIDNGTTQINAYAFSGVKSLKSVSIPASIETIGADAFSGCENLLKADLPEGITSIEGGAFLGCTQFCKVVIPDSVTAIGEGAFSECGLTSVTIGKGVKEIGPAGFSRNNSLKEINYNATECADLEHSEALFFCFLDEVDESIEITATIGANVKRIPNNLFFNCFSLKNVYFEEGSVCTYIGEDAFDASEKLTTIEIPDSVTYMGEQSFQFATQLQYNEYENGYYLGNKNNPYVVLVDIEAPGLETFKIHNNTKIIYEYVFSGQKKLTKIAIPDEVRFIGKSAFSGCNELKQITMSKNVKFVQSRAFDGCWRLETVYYKGTEADWNKMDIDMVGLRGNVCNLELVNALRYYYSETPPMENSDGNYWYYDENGEIMHWN